MSLAAVANFPASGAASDVPAAGDPGETTLHGSVQSLAGRYLLLVLDDRGYVDRVTLRDATALSPADLRLSPGLAIVVIGRPDGTTFDADEIDLADASGMTRSDAGGARPTYAADDAAAPADGPALDVPAFETAADGTYASSSGAPYAGPAFGIVFGSALSGGFAFGNPAPARGPGTAPGSSGAAGPPSGRRTLPVNRAPATGDAPRPVPPAATAREAPPASRTPPATRR